MRTPDASPFRAGFWAGLPFILVIIPFALLFGVVATEAGFDLLQTMAMSGIIVAGASQFAAVALLEDSAPTLVILATCLAVNLRMAMYSAALTPHLGPLPLWRRALVAYLLVDQSYATAIQKYDAAPEMSPLAKYFYYFGAVAAICPAWFLFSYIGAMVGETIPPEYALDFALPITFLAIVAPYLRDLAHVAAAFVSVVGALAFAFVPYSLGLLLAALLAMLTGAVVEIWMERKGLKP